MLHAAVKSHPSVEKRDVRMGHRAKSPGDGTVGPSPTE
jgi:hypothetical protein